MRTCTTQPRRRRGPHSAGFTLIELLVSISIILILAMITAGAINAVRDADRERAGSRSIQAFLEGARARAVARKHPVGVRFIRDEVNPDHITSMVFIEEPATSHLIGELRIANDGNNRPRVITATDRAAWKRAYDRKLLVNGARILLEDNWYSLWNAAGDGTDWRLTRDFSGPTSLSVPYKLKMYPAPMPNQTPIELPGEVAININSSQVPSHWPVPTSPPASPPPPRHDLDILFSPRGQIAGSLTGIVHLVIEAKDAQPDDSRYIVSVFAATGRVGTSAVAGSIDPFKYAELGEESQ